MKINLLSHRLFILIKKDNMKHNQLLTINNKLILKHNKITNNKMS